MLELKNVTKDYRSSKGTFRALDGITLSLPNKGLIALYGENGCGKTTLLNSISLLDTDYSGDIMFNGNNILNFANAYRRNIVSVVLQENSFVPFLNITDNIKLFCEKESQGLISDWLNDFDILEKAQEYPCCVSGGQKQRVSLIRGLSKKYSVLLVDEPTSSLNQLMEAEVFKRLQTLAKDKLIILVSHDLSLIRKYADMVIFMDKGRVSSAECLGSDEIVYWENQIEIPKTIHDFGALDTSKVKLMLEKNKFIKLTYSSSQLNSFSPDYVIHKSENLEKQRKLGGDSKKHIVISSLKKKMGITSVLTLVIVFLAVLMGILCSLARFNQHSFAFKSINNNIDGPVNFQMVTITNDHTTSFNLKNCTQMKNELGSRLIIRNSFDNYTSLGFGTSGIYSADIMGFAYCSPQDVTIVAGQFANGSSVMLTDYLADALVLLDEKFDSIETIFLDGIYVGGVHLNVQGIVDTDYEIYRGLYDSGNFSSSQKYIDYQQKIPLYHSIFFPICSEGVIPILPIQYGEQYANVVVLNQLDINEGEHQIRENPCLLSPSLYSSLSENSIIKLSNCYLNVCGCKETETSDNVIYVTRETIDIINDCFFEDISTVTIDLSSEKEIEFLDECGLQHTTSVSGYIYRVIDTIFVLRKMFVIILLALFVVSLIFAISVVNQFLDCDRQLIGFMRIAGYSKGSLWSIEILKAAILLLTSVLIAELLLYGSTYGLNAALSHLFHYSISIFTVDISAICAVVLDILFVFAIALVRCILYFKKQGVDLVK